MPNGCVSTVRSRKIALGDKGSAHKAYILNEDQSEHDLVRVDGCLLNNEEAADWLIRKRGIGSVIVEIKGSDVGKALNQIISTYNHKSAKIHIENKCGFLVVCSRMPQFDTSIQRAMQKARSIGKLRVACRGGEFSVESLI